MSKTLMFVVLASGLSVYAEVADVFEFTHVRYGSEYTCNVTVPIKYASNAMCYIDGDYSPRYSLERVTGTDAWVIGEER